MGRRGNPYDSAKAESFMNTLKVEAIYLMDYETFEEVTADFHASSIKFTTPAAPLRARLPEPGSQFKDYHTRQAVKAAV